MIDDPLVAVAELARVLRPGGTVMGSAFVSDGTRRQRALFALARRQGHAAPRGSGADHVRWLEEAGLTDVEVGEGGFVVFRARKPDAYARATIG